ncbi:MAG: lipopolysaccharide biosynthesis protein [Burkholderiales bacterium]|nr:lipopolysaccharide biosynthesis protein [Burkholderiales bacterium]
MKEQVAKSVFWMVWSRGVLQVLSFITTIVVARWLSPSDYGLMALAGIWISVLVLISEFGLGAAVLQFRDLSVEELNFCFYLGFSLASICYAALYFAAPFIGDWFNAPALADVLRVVGLTLLISALAIIPDGLLRKQLQLDKVTKAEVSGAVVSLVTVLALAWNGAGVWALIYGMLARAAVQSFALYLYWPWRPGWRVSGSRRREILDFSSATFGSRLMWTLYDQSDSLVLGKVSGEVALGFYTMARDLASIPVTRISSLVNQMSVPLMATLQDDRVAMRKMLLRGLRLTASVSTPICLGFILVAEDLVRVVLSDKWLPMVPVLQLLSVLSLIRSIDVLIAPVLRARFRTTFLAAYNAVLFVVMPLAFLVGAHSGGGVGVATAWVVVYPLVMTRMIGEAFREIELPWRMFWDQLRAPTNAALFMTVAVLVLQLLIKGDELGIAVTRLAVCSGVGAVIYVGVLWLSGGPLRDELREVLGWIFKRHGGKAGNNGKAN